MVLHSTLISETQGRLDAIMPTTTKHILSEIGMVALNPPIPNGTLSYIEQRLNSRLPDDYRAFLGTFGGGILSRLVMFSSLNSLSSKQGDTEGTINLLYGLHPNDARADLSTAIKQYLRRLPPGFMPIGEDMFSNQICLGLIGEERARVFLWNHELPGPEDDPSNLVLIANSFEEFVSSFH